MGAQLKHNNPKVGMACMVAAMFIFAVVNACVKQISHTYDIWQITFFRFFLTMGPAFYLLNREGLPHSLKTTQWKMLLTLGALGAGAVYVLFKAFHIGRLADVTALAYSSILFLTVLAVPVLKEKVDGRRWLAVLVGFSGVLLMASPDKNFQVGSLLGLLFAFMDAWLMILIRILTRKDKTSTVVFYFALFASLTSLPFMLFSFKMPTSFQDILYFLFIGIGGGIGQIFLTSAYRFAPASTVAPMIYTAMIWGGLFGVIFFGEPLTVPLISGAIVVVLSSLYIIHRENKVRSQDLILE